MIVTCLYLILRGKLRSQKLNVFPEKKKNSIIQKEKRKTPEDINKKAYQIHV